MNAFRIGVWTGASTAPELDGALAMVDGIELRLPYQSDPTSRNRINTGDLEYIDIHLSHVAQHVWFGFLGKLHVAIVELTAILEDGRLVPSTSIGNNKTWLDLADKVILEVNSWQTEKLEGIHDVYYGTQLPPRRVPIPIVRPDDRIGDRYYRRGVLVAPELPADGPDDSPVSLTRRPPSPNRAGPGRCSEPPELAITRVGLVDPQRSPRRREIRHNVPCGGSAFIARDVRVVADVQKSLPGGAHDRLAGGIVGIVERHRPCDHGDEHGTRVTVPAAVTASREVDHLDGQIEIRL